MLGRFALTSVALVSIAIVPARSQDHAANISLVTSAGPYEVKGETGVIGFVVASSGDIVRFKPCTGEPFFLNRKQLTSTNNRCADSPSSQENPLVANCDNALHGWNSEQLAQAVQDDGPVGTTFFKNDSGAMVMASIATDPKKTAAAIDSTYQLKDCGQYVIGFDKNGEAKVSLIPKANAIQLDDSQK